jgi:dTDP-4-dehydrorhamnose 3,5-epimerase
MAMGDFDACETEIPGVKKLFQTTKLDNRGSFSKLFTLNETYVSCEERGILQVNLSCNAREGTIRGLHFQRMPKPDSKIVTVLQGEIWDVVLDLRLESPTYLQWKAFQINPKSGFSLLIPEGCAHGFQTLKNETEILYLHSEVFYSDLDSGINPLDSELSIPWPINEKIISERDRNLPWLNSLKNSLGWQF